MSSTDSSSTESSRVDMSDWELVTMDKTQWTLLVKQLEDLLALQCLLKMKPPTECLCVVKAAGLVEPVRVSVKKVMDGGRGECSGHLLRGFVNIQNRIIKKKCWWVGGCVKGSHGLSKQGIFLYIYSFYPG